MHYWQSKLKEILREILWEFSHTPQQLYDPEMDPAFTMDPLCHPLHSDCADLLWTLLFLTLPLPEVGNVPLGILLLSSLTYYSTFGSIFSIESQPLRKLNCLGNWVTALVCSPSTHQLLKIFCWSSNGQDWPRLKHNRWPKLIPCWSVWVSRWFSHYLN